MNKYLIFISLMKGLIIMLRNNNDIHEFAKRLKWHSLPIFFNTLRIPDISRDIAWVKLVSLNKRIEFGVRMILDAYREDHINPITKELENQLWVRSMYLETAIESYNKVLDYICTILYFYYKIDECRITSRNDVEIISENQETIRYNYISQELQNHGDDVDEFLKLLKKYKRDTSRNRSFANNLKHWGYLTVKGLELNTLEIIYNIKGEEVDYNSIINGKVIDIDEEIEKLVIIHNMTLELMQALYDLCFSKLIVKGKHT